MDIPNLRVRGNMCFLPRANEAHEAQLDTVYERIPGRLQWKMEPPAQPELELEPPTRVFDVDRSTEDTDDDSGISDGE